MIQHKIYITGYGQFSNLGSNTKEAFHHLKNVSNENILSYTNVDSPELTQKYIFNEKFDDISLNLSETNRLALYCINEALTMASLSKDEIKQFKVGIIIGTTSGCTNSNPELSKNYFVDQSYDFDLFENSYFNNPASTIANILSLSGPFMTINNACTAGADAIGLGANWIEQGVCDIVIAGGAESILDNMYYGFKSLGLIAEKSTKPFDKTRDGLVLGQGAGFVILEKKNSRKEQFPKAELLGYGTVSDPYHPTSPPPDAKGLLGACKKALQQAQIKETEISLINAHATGTPTNDKIEGRFLKKHFSKTPVFATKPYTGHCLGASGAVEVIWGISCLEDQYVPHTLGFQLKDDEIDLKPAEAGPRRIKNYLSTSLGFGGVNSCVIIGEAYEQ